MPELRVVLPTRWRTDNVRRFVDGFYRTAELDTALTIVMDEDDEAMLAIRDELPPQVEVIVLPNAGTAAKVNAGALPHLDDSQALMFLGDDNVFEQHGWDRHIMDAFATNGPGMVYVNDLGGREQIVATNIAISSDIVRALGYFDHPSMYHFAVDMVWVELGRACGCLWYLPDVVIQHKHWLFGHPVMDQLYAQTQGTWFDRDNNLYSAWLADPNGRDADVAKIKAVLGR